MIQGEPRVDGFYSRATHDDNGRPIQPPTFNGTSTPDAFSPYASDCGGSRNASRNSKRSSKNTGGSSNYYESTSSASREIQMPQIGSSRVTPSSGVPIVSPMPVRTSVEEESEIPAPREQFVVDLPLDIQRGFRRKLLTILLLQLLLSVGTGLVVKHGINGGIQKVFPAQSLQTLALGFVCVFTLPALSYVRDRHPWNMLATSCWSISWGVFLAAAQVPGGIVRSNALFVMFGSATLGVCLLLLLCWIPATDPITDAPSLISFGNAGGIAWVLMITGSIIFYANTTHLYVQAGHYIGALIVASALFAWVCYDAARLCDKMQPDDYMAGVVCFYTDFLLVCCCCLVLGCFTGSSS